MVLIALFFFFPIISSTMERKEAYSFLVFSDIHLDHSFWWSMGVHPHGINILNDLDEETFKKLLSAIHLAIQQGSVPKPKFILVLGDIAGHLRIFPQSTLKNEKAVFSLLKSEFADIPIFYTFGNNDSLKANYGSFYDTHHSHPLKSPYEVAEVHGHWQNGFLSTGKNCKAYVNRFPCIITEDPINGYYTAYIEPHFRLISLNSVLFRAHPPSDNRATRQLHWLANQLQIAKTKQDRVLITMHIPFGNNIYDHQAFWDPHDEAFFLQLIQTYHDSIAGLLAGHTHDDELKVIKNAQNQTLTGLFITPSLSTSHGNAPAFKVFTYALAQNRWQLLDFTTYHFVSKGTGFVLQFLYDFKNTYCAAQKSFLACLGSVRGEDLKPYYTAGNPNFAGIMAYPKDSEIIIPQDESTQLGNMKKN